MPAFSWTVVVLTCQHKDSVYAFHRELELRQRRGCLCASTLLLTVQDRQEPLGSGGATLNALLVAAEHLSSRAGHTVVTADVLNDAHILILHTGRDFPWSSCSRAFSWLPVEDPGLGVQAPICCLDVLLSHLTQQVCSGSPPGVWVCSTDMTFTVPANFVPSWDSFSGVCALALPGDVSYAVNHGVYLSGQKGHVRDIIYKGSPERIRQALMHDGKVPLVSGPVFFSRPVAEKLLQLHVTPPLDGCTYLGLDSGAPPFQLSLFLDVLKCLCSDLTEDEFVGGGAPASGPRGALLQRGRKELWRILRGTPLTLAYVPGGSYDYMTLSGKEHVLRLTRDPARGHALSHIQVASGISDGGRIINSVLEGEVTVATGAVVQHCHLQGPLRVPFGCLLSGLEASTSPDVARLPLDHDIIIQGHRIKLGDLKLKVYTVMGGLDDLELPCDAQGASFANIPWHLFFSRTGIRPEDLWEAGGRRCPLEARLFPFLHPTEGGVGLAGGVGWLLGGAGCAQRWRKAWRLSLKEVLSLTHQEAELRWRETLLFLAGRKRTKDALMGQSDVCLLPSFRAAVAGGQQGALLDMLDDSEYASLCFCCRWKRIDWKCHPSVAAGSAAEQGEEPQREDSLDDGDVHVSVGEGAEPGAQLGVSARCLSCIADVLTSWAEAEGGGGLRSGPAANQNWRAAYVLLEKGELKGGVRALAAQRADWLSRPDLLVRAARHYEGAAQVLLRRAVMSSQKFVAIGQGELPPIGQWHEVECPARIDLAGGWSDTPPLAFERGGCVTNVAVKIDSRRPIGARARRIRRPLLLLVSHSGGRDSDVAAETVCETADHLRDYCQPNAPGALLKAVCVCAGVASPTSQDALALQLTARWGGGLELHGWSALPTGSGLGTSSILAGALLAAVYGATGRSYSRDALVHAVLHLEQVLTTGGGWQDQVGGLEGGLKVGRSQARLPLQVHVERLRPPDGFAEALERRLLLVYTGKTRLARNLLQDVVRNWYARLPVMVRNAHELVTNGEDCARACLDGCLSSLGRCLDRSWQHKKTMAPGCEPASVRLMMEALRPLVLGQSLAGAGGGGFLCLLTRQPDQKDEVVRVLANTPGLDFSVHTVQLDLDGLTVLQPV
ncbi:L-fucose kinase isoform X2 [Hippocampus zosterae]|uniref:L-fucose kinase isoform X2 n=1 Tax=Hippocampus zosterae TaxID=109293 RepID=UPI00223E259D|nr:L-fucose kinase isoform X2 [Hippocampus zosterae]